ncbi:Protein of unknown function [Pyronema omphalodes CBS 100304]|uniref:Uncharacterized protein n=1 Tax=Pyronema omphalodes (strain CBS 100304) TaxID=1076935 RepID=U4KZS1_PYROM|nr:Protein of unknown function [Pyronema omphalodes CBS 100304]
MFSNEMKTEAAENRIRSLKCFNYAHVEGHASQNLRFISELPSPFPAICLPILWLYERCITEITDIQKTGHRLPPGWYTYGWPQLSTGTRFAVRLAI